jgi:hypothetical protein
MAILNGREDDLAAAGVGDERQCRGTVRFTGSNVSTEREELAFDGPDYVTFMQCFAHVGGDGLWHRPAHMAALE